MVGGLARHFGVLVHLTLLEGWRTRFMVLAVLAMGSGLLVAGFAGELAIAEAREVRVAILGSWLRLCAVLLITLFAVNSQMREMHDKQLEMFLALPRQRGIHLVGRVLGQGAVALLLAVLFVVPLVGSVPVGQVALWGFSLWVEQWIVAIFGLMSVLVLRQVPLAVTATCGFYWLARSLEALQLVGQGPIMPVHSPFLVFVNSIIVTLNYLIPALHRFTRAEWLMYGSGTWEDFRFIAAQGVAACLLLTGMALFDFARRRI
ncbi:MAG: ABC transporter permease [Magnetococcales bacterium]|nr:ABC transporter permease [Magnetococcales bacterium]